MTTDLHMTTGGRLRLVADHIEAHQELWDQSQWTAAGLTIQPAEEAGLGECDTPHCVAGWAVRFTPAEQVASPGWHDAGRAALGLEPDLARAIFAGTYRPKSMPDVLRLVAGLPEGGRTLRAAIAAGLRDLTGANLTGADLTRANLTRANLTRANLTRANLTDAYLSGADLTGANLARAYLTGADLTGADLSGADFTRSNLTGAYLTGARADERTRLPAGWAVRDGQVVPDE